MDFKFNSADPDLRANIQLLKSHIERKSALSYEINQMNIRSNLKNSSNNRDQKELLQLSKMLSRRLTEMRAVSEKIKKISIKEITKENLDKIFESISVVEPKVDLPRDIFSLNFETETYIHSLKDYYIQLSESYHTKQQELDETAKQTKDFELLVNTAEELEREIGDYLLEIKGYSEEIKRLAEIKEKLASRKRGSVEKVKGFQFLSNNAIVLKSKYLLKNELISSLSVAEKELDLSNQKILQKQAKIKEDELEQEYYLKNSAVFDRDLKDLLGHEKKLEKKLEALNAEKKQIIKKISSSKNFQILFARSATLNLGNCSSPKGGNILKQSFTGLVKDN